MTIPSTFAEQDDPNRNASHLYLGGACITSQLGHRAIITEVSHEFPHFLKANSTAMS